ALSVTSCVDARPGLRCRNVVHGVRDHAVVAEGPPLQHGEPGRLFDGRCRCERKRILRTGTDYDWTLKDNQTVYQRSFPESARQVGSALDEERPDALRRQMFQSII